MRFSERDGLTVVAFAVSTGGWMVNLMLKRRLRRSVFQTKNGVQRRDGWRRSTVELNGVIEWIDVLNLDCCDGLDG